MFIVHAIEILQAPQERYIESHYIDEINVQPSGRGLTVARLKKHQRQQQSQGKITSRIHPGTSVVVSDKLEEALIKVLFRLSHWERGQG